ncbi:unnamed protein product, partial [marine sediment metagenome]
DKNIKDTEQSNRDLRSNIDGYGEIDITPVEKADGYALKKERTKILDEYASEKLVLDKKNEEIKKDSDKRNGYENFLTINNLSIKNMKKAILEMEEKNKTYRIWIKENPIKDTLPPIPLPDTKKVDEDIS